WLAGPAISSVTCWAHVSPPSHTVMKFMDVYQRSFCRPIETLVDIFQEYPDEIEFIFKPSCVPLMRCGGCCNDESLECVPTEESNITMQIMRIKPHQSQHIGEMSFLQHNKCECRPKKDKARQENPCGPCSERRKHLFVQDPQTCKCSCKNTDSRCKARQLELNERTCSPSRLGFIHLCDPPGVCTSVPCAHRGPGKCQPGE
uniref:Vascular endothelial growth factor A n=1 Tax=Capra hircus TaxID=9925 RepID=A0A8C2RU80_CAPHI